MKNILIIRSCNIKVFDMLVKYINKLNEKASYKIYCMIQENSCDSFKEKYPYIEYIKKENGAYKYKKFKTNFNLKKKLNSIKFDEIYIPSSSDNFNGFDETLLIVSKIKSEKVILFNNKGEACKYSPKFIIIFMDKYLSKVMYYTKVVVALFLISLTYIVGYPYYFLKNILKRN